MAALWRGVYPSRPQPPKRLWCAVAPPTPPTLVLLHKEAWQIEQWPILSFLSLVVQPELPPTQVRLVQFFHID